MAKFKIDKKWCRKCKYHGTGSISGQIVYCNYCSIVGETCLKHDGSDIRGDGPECNLYSKGERIIKEKAIEDIAYGRKLKGEWK